MFAETDAIFSQIINDWLIQLSLLVTQIYIYCLFHQDSSWQVACGICFDNFPPDGIRSLKCGHPFCTSCWKGLFLVEAFGHYSFAFALKLKEVAKLSCALRFIVRLLVFFFFFPGYKSSLVKKCSHLYVQTLEAWH